ncbi:uncharacterized protein BDR25DRAFT_264416 [Lindgomyces ingoldianus]|uniref:Uncharacterized protein n=1 Tax=Lindgomyces ingoldianus TaxID=673940 RepID=A0ACB6QQ97_9PLEO|nr:uncharacterized protein BDR25DRAFT_264416 [Lindgomyces ingoldianus]KAF2469189.1 hypothetical protein BDR25DRAFT_264416 [Lindgomyces ingoldianus]
MIQLVRHAVWQAAQADFTDSVSVRNLEATVNAGVDAWGRQKTQRVLLTPTLTLVAPFSSAAQSDSLDTSTIHYGKLSKAIRALIQDSSIEWKTTNSMAKAILDSSLATADKAPIASAQLDIFYPKGSMLGDGAGLMHCMSLRPTLSLSRVLYLRNVRIPCLIGINSNERLQKQPVIVNLWIECISEDRSDDYTQLEQVLVNAVSESSFETLESLSTMLVEELRQKFFRPAKDDNAFVRLRVEKPMAVPFAEAPAIEIMRPVKV